MKFGEFDGETITEKTSHYIPVAQTPQNAHPSKNKFENLSNLTGSQPQKKTTRYIPVTRTPENETPPKKKR